MIVLLVLTFPTFSIKIQPMFTIMLFYTILVKMRKDVTIGELEKAIKEDSKKDW